ncbi:MAG TPA: helical backbone metal receptor [Candidatus Binataceae bacterium]|nr:helical backbone metal receptor [Candidatus Binataceae bacterium]
MRSPLLLAALAITAACARSPSLRSTAPRIISLTPAVTETLFALGAGAEVVGVSQYCDYPPAARRLPRIGSFLTPNLEAIVALRPTLVIGLNTSSDLREIRALNAMGIATLMVDDDSVVAIERSIESIGAAIGRAADAQRLEENLRRRLAATAQRLRSRPSRSVLMIVGHQPLVAVGRDNFLNDLLTLAHADNIGAVSDQAWPRLSLEYILASAPEVILDGQMGSDPGSPSYFWSRYPSLPAVRHHRVFGYPDDPTLHPGPRIDQTLDLLAARIHPEAFGTTQPRLSAE